jgi:diaminopimelate decarboxylase
MQNGKLWWEREDLCYRDGRLHFGGRDLEALAASSGTPTFVYHATRVSANLERLRAALDSQGVAHDAFFAIKASRFAPLVTFLKLRGRCGIDACSPAELTYARQAGFEEAEISYTGTSVSDTDLDCLQRHPGVHVNCDSISTIRRLGRRCPGRRIGIRINPEIGAGYNEKLRYAGDKPTKFGIYRDRFDEALRTARDAGMRVETLHFHIGSGYQGDAVEDSINYPKLLRLSPNLWPKLSALWSLTQVVRMVPAGLGLLKLRKISPTSSLKFRLP